MYNTPRKNNGNRTYGTPNKVPLKGLFQDGVWHCKLYSASPAVEAPLNGYRQLQAALPSCPFLGPQRGPE
jgi:hypothetical protein